MQKHLDTYSSKKLYDEIRTGIDETYEMHVGRILTHVYPGSSRMQESDEASKSMAQYVPQIKKLSKLPGGLELAFRLILYLGRKPYFQTEETPSSQPSIAWSGSRKPDTLADILLLEILQRKRKENKGFRPEEEYESLNRQRKLFWYLDGEPWHDSRVFFVHKDLPTDAKIGSKDSYFPKSYEYMWSLIEGPAAVNRFHDDLAD